ncbi:hypothetical protein ACOSQ2_020987 [Xanthoceras sorbifolium]
MNPNKNLVGLGIILRDHSGSVLAASAQKLAIGFSVSIAEAVAVLKGLQLALELDLLPVIVETDFLDVATTINNPSVYFSEVGLVISDIVDLLGRCPRSKVLYVPRSANIVVHTLARFALEIDSDRFWQNYYPNCISEALEFDNQGIV